MNIKKAIGAGLLVFALPPVITNVIGNTVGPFLSKALGQGAALSYLWQIIIAIILAAAAYSIAKWYFTGNAASTIKGLQLGGIFVATNFVINLMQTAPIAAFGDYGQNVWQPLIKQLFNADDHTLLISVAMSVAITVGAAVLAGHMGAKRTAGACNVKDAVGTCMPEEGVEA